MHPHSLHLGKPSQNMSTTTPTLLVGINIDIVAFDLRICRKDDAVTIIGITAGLAIFVIPGLIPLVSTTAIALSHFFC